MATTIMIILFFASLSLLIVLHEFGHYLPARLFKTKVEKFYLFMDPYFSLFKKQIGDTEFGIGWLPLGGYVKIAGMIDESMDKEQMKGPVQDWEFRAKKPWQRLIIMLGGIIVNFILGFFILSMLTWQYGESYLSPAVVGHNLVADSIGRSIGMQDGDLIKKIGTEDFNRFDPSVVVRNVVIDNARTIELERAGKMVTLNIPNELALAMGTRDFNSGALFHAKQPVGIAEVAKGGPAAQAGLKAGDQLVQMDGKPMEDLDVFFNEIAKLAGKTVRIAYLRDGQEYTTEVAINEHGKMNIQLQPLEDFYAFDKKHYGFFQSLPIGVSKGVNILHDQIKAFGQMFRGNIDVQQSLGGPIAIANMFPRSFDGERFWRMTAILSLILGFMNLLPIPALDGGHVMFLLWEMISGKKPSDRFMEITTMAGFFILLSLMVFVFGNDIYNFMIK